MQTSQTNKPKKRSMSTQTDEVSVTCSSPHPIIVNMIMPSKEDEYDEDYEPQKKLENKHIYVSMTIFIFKNSTRTRKMK